MKKLDLGNSDFKSIIENNNYFVDKSLFIKEIIDTQKQVLLLPRPRRFGKTLNLSMLHYYFDIDQRNEPNLFENLAIWKTEDEIKEKHTKYPTMFISFKDAKEENWLESLELIINEIIELYTSCNFLLETDVLSQNEKTEFENIINKTEKNTTYQQSLKKLSKYLSLYYNQKVIILIDEYDTPIQAGYKRFYTEVVSFMRNLLSGALKDNKYLYKGVITGILRVSKESIFSGLNNISVYSILDEEFSDKFGFTESETKQILADLEVPTEYSQIKNWYNGYKIGTTTDIYNPWSILNYAVAHKAGFKPYWINTSSDELLKEQIKAKNANRTREQLLELISNQSIEKIIDENFVFTDLDRKKDLMWTLLAFSGYLTIDQKLSVNRYLLKIPNYEIKYVFQTIILDWLEAEVKIQQNLLIETTKFLINNEIEKFERGFKEIIGDTFSYFDLQGEPENVYQSYVLGLLAIVGDDYIIKSNRESGEGRYDICLIPHDTSKYGIVIEIKQISRDAKDNHDTFVAKINHKIIEAKTQIDKNQYYKELIDHKIPNIIKLPIVFAGKEPYIIPIQHHK
jgi:hypothetical protein